MCLGTLINIKSNFYPYLTINVRKFIYITVSPIYSSSSSRFEICNNKYHCDSAQCNFTERAQLL